MKQFIAFATLALSMVSGAHIRYVRDLASYADGNGAATSRSGVTLIPLEPIAIVRSVFNGPTGDEPGFDFSYETENGIQQEVIGEMRDVNGAEVVVMRGSYTYKGEDGEDVVVSWYADETGYHPESDILPIAPEIPFPDQAEAVAAQIRFAQEELARGATPNNGQYVHKESNGSQGGQIIVAARDNQGSSASAATNSYFVAAAPQAARASAPQPARAAANDYAAASAAFVPVAQPARAAANDYAAASAAFVPVAQPARAAANDYAAASAAPFVPAAQPARAAANDYAAAEASAPVAFEPVDDAVVQEVRFIEVAQPEYTRANNNAQATYLDSQPIIEVVREAEPARYNRGPEVNSRQSTFGNEPVSPVQAKSRAQPAYIQYLLN